MRKSSFCLYACILLIGGCGWSGGPQELERLVKEDPSFKVMIVQRDETHARIRAIKDDLHKKKQALDTQIQMLRADYDLYAKEQNRVIDQSRASIEANRNRLRAEIETAELSVESKRQELEGYGRTMADIEKVLKEPRGITLANQEMKKWDERTTALRERMRLLTDEIQDLRLQIRLKKQKIGYLQ